MTRIWTRDAILAAALRWVESRGCPPGWNDWRLSSPHHPTANTVRRMFGSWSAMIGEAGLPVRGRGGVKVWSRGRAERALLEWCFVHGRQPVADDWRPVGPGRPSLQQVTRMYGSWAAFLVAAGYEPRRRFRERAGVLV